ncbi:MAG: hypothetical protein COT73_12520 [Bdellovibrio sp. CG10_big_fil_rev_8_21_14_0_10_47_8]|nr:MAG: hypothetical protein COT73_12520 [Bdellovibrio sp. CG10_big_fil_rev_8_21_14_0_10_47_8]
MEALQLINSYLHNLAFAKLFRVMAYFFVVFALFLKRCRQIYPFSPIWLNIIVFEVMAKKFFRGKYSFPFLRLVEIKIAWLVLGFCIF